MIRQSARLLPRAKLEGLIHGLRQRCAAGAERIAHEVQVLREALAELESSSTQAATAEQARHAQQYAATITDWDQRRLSAWDEVEQRVVRTIKGTAAAEKEARSAAKQRSEQIASELKERYADIEKRFLRSKDKAVLQLNQARQQVERLGGDLAVIQQEATNLLAQRGLTPEPISVVQIDEPPTNSASAIAACRHELQQAQQHLQRLSNHPLARLIESIGFWVGCLLGGSGIAAIIGSLGWLNWPIALVVGLVVAVVLGISGMLAVHPWLRRLLKTEFPLVESALAQARAMQHAAAQLAIAENDAELKRIAHKRDDRYAKANEWREQAAKEVGDQLKQELNRLKEELASKQVAMRAYLTLAIQEIDQAGAKSEQNLVEAFQKHQLAQMQHVAAERARIEQLIHRTDRGGAERMQIALEHALNWFSRSQQWNQANAPRWEQMLSDDSWPQALSRPILPLGQVQVEALLAGQQSAKRDTPVAAPLYFEPLQDQYLTITADPNSSHCQQLIKALLLRTLTSLPPGKTQVMVIDPPGLGRDYGWLMHLGDYDAELVSHRVWTQSNHIAKNLSQLALKAEDFIQQSLRNQYATIEQYNREAGPLAEPFRILLWSSFPVGLDDQSWKPLQSILDTGARCGIVPIFVIDPAQPWDSDQRRELLMRRGLHVRWNDETKGWIAETPALRDLPIRTVEPPSEEVTDALVHQVGRRALLASRVEVPLSGIAPPRDQWWQADSSGSLDIPIGQSGVGRVQSLKLGVGTAQHAIVAGKTGSGKSTLLHAIITSAAVKYSPERLRLVLLDFKKGVEFQAYSQAELPHADIIGIESQREFGLSALQYVDQCLQSRGDMFRQAGVQDLQSWNLLNPSQQLPRMMIVIDEFQELFVEDDKLTSQVSLILDRIVRQGRSFGVHAVLSSQTLAGAYSLPRTTMGQMAIRIALQCDPSDAQLIFADDNPAAARLQHPGQAVYNDQGGRIEGNQSMQIGWLTKKDMLDWLNHLPGRGYRNTDPSTNVLGRTVVFDGNRAATWDSGAASRAVTAARTQWNPDACWCVLGESVAISPAVTVPLTDQAGRNLMLVGSDDSQAASVALAIARSFAAHYAPQRVAKLALLQAAKPTDACCLSLPQHLQAISSDVQVADVRGLESLLGELHAQLKSRIEQPEGFAQWQPILLTIVNIGRFRDLRPEDEFGMGSFGESKLTPDKQLEELLRDGPSHHIHILLMAENANTIGRWLSRAALREIEIRLLMQMSANDSTQLIDSVAAAHLGEHVMLLHDDATSSELRFRPYAFDSLTEAGAASNKADT